jgi:hypothetical protein
MKKKKLNSFLFSVAANVTLIIYLANYFVWVSEANSKKAPEKLVLNMASLEKKKRTIKGAKIMKERIGGRT